MNDDYVTTQVLPQRVVTAAISGTDAERKHAGMMLEEATNSARIAGLDRTVGRLVDTQVAHGRRLSDAERQIELIERELRAVDGRLPRYALIVLAMVLIIVWAT